MMTPTPSSSAGPSNTVGHETFSAAAYQVQAHGVVMQLQADAFTIIRVSCNAEALLGMNAEALVGRPLQAFLGEQAVTQLQALQSSLKPVDYALRPQYVSLTLDSGQVLEGWFHQTSTTSEATSTTSTTTSTSPTSNEWLLELEVPRSASKTQTTTAQFQQFRSQVSQLQRMEDESELLQAAAIATQQLTRLDRVLVYRFAPDGSGTVMAEVKQPESATSDISYLGLRFPATDIPEESRHAYRQGMFRYVPDLQAPSVDCSPTFEIDENATPSPSPSPLQHAVFRGVDDCCITYHRNIQVQAFLAIPLVQHDRLWGLLVGHHSTAVTIPPAVRLDCTWLGQILAAELAKHESQRALAERERLKAHQSDFLAAIAQSDDFIQGLIKPELRLLGLANAQGAAIFFEDQITTVGTVPPDDFLRGLYDWAIKQVDDSICCTHNLPQAYPAAEGHKEQASGLLFLLISSARRYAIAWFRPEVLQTVTWAGNPADSYEESAAGELQLCPRASFAQWKETVCQTALPWQIWEVESALDLRNAIVGVVLRKADEMTRINQALERSNQELAAFAYAASHDLKEPLRGINNYTRLLLKENQTTLSDKAVARLNTLSKLTRRMSRLIDALLRFSRIGQTELHLQSLDLNLLIARVIEMHEINQPERQLDIWTPRPLPSVEADPVLLSEVYNNLLSNALKYNTSATPWVELGYYNAEEIATEPRLPRSLTAPVLYVRDNGIGIPEEHWAQVFDLFKRLHSQKKYGGGTGAGLTITKKIIERHNGAIGLFSDENGTTFYWSLG